MRSQTKVTGIMLPEVHGAKEMLDTNVCPEKQKHHIHREQLDKNRPRLGRGRTGIKCKNPNCYVWHMLFDSIDQTVTQDVKGLQRNHKHVLFPAMQFLPQLQCCPIRGKLTTSMHI